jgi:hypothetical protein
MIGFITKAEHGIAVETLNNRGFLRLLEPDPINETKHTHAFCLTRERPERTRHALNGDQSDTRYFYPFAVG